MTARTPRRLLVVGACVAALAGCAGEPAPAAPPPPSATATPTPSPTSTPSPSPSPPASVAEPAGNPVRVVVEGADGTSIVDAPIEPHGLDDSGVLSPPSGVVGWYDEAGWPKPGYPGAAILAGHVGVARADIFRDLPKAGPGDAVAVTYDSGDVVRFVVVRSSGVPKDQTPKDDSIWDAGNPEPLLRLITCDPTTPLRDGHYKGNWVLWADLA
ncbi:class F sortase [Phycicoccus sp. CSK15P-2]|uniref:class F sortase n=1 Tax=Phycicoccus sp. CSK15P-2 TaxID=2807627 RepID=UPI00194FD2E4|nr:class F sortase [Phycicoccus sp. CSK15P-2]MBM6405562.1 class F sortase [Phycicoccus sp. CSK15P-2]